MQIVEAPTGKIEIQAPHATTIDVAPGAYLCDALVTITATNLARASEQFIIVAKRAVTTA